MKYDKSIISRLGTMLAVALFALVSFTSCSDDAEKTPLQMPTVTQDGQTVSSLAFHWDAVADATQYAYELSDPFDRVVAADVTQTTSLLATGLEPNTEYTLKVWAFTALNSDKTTSPIAVLKATTTTKIPLVAPSSATAHLGNGAITVTWPAVENATAYKYVLSGVGGVSDGTTHTNSVVLDGLEVGQYTISIVATSDDENYADSEPFVFSFERTRTEIWRHSGTYYKGNLPEGSNSFVTEIVAYDDGSYTILKPYGVDGYDIHFAVNEAEEIVPLGYEKDSGFDLVQVTKEYELNIYSGEGYSSFMGGAKRGRLWFWSILYSPNEQIGEGAYDRFEWGWDVEYPTDRLAGVYNGKSEGQDYLGEGYTLQDVSRIDEVHVTAIDEDVLVFEKMYGWDGRLYGKVDFEAKTITFQPTTWNTYYVFAAHESETTPVVAHFDDDYNITFDNFTAWYGGNAFIFCTSTLSPTD